jgi:hypothetical protein
MQHSVWIGRSTTVLVQLAPARQFLHRETVRSSISLGNSLSLLLRPPAMLVTAEGSIPVGGRNVLISL